MNVVHLALDNLEKYGEYTFLCFNGQGYSNIYVDKKSNYLGYGLQERGLKKDERVIVFLDNMPEVVISYYAILRIGAIVVPVNPQMSAEDLAHIISDCEPGAVITSARLSATVSQALDLACLKPQVIVVGDVANEENISIEDCYVPEDTLLMTDRPDDAAAAIIYTSGTTGPPKGVVLSHFNLYMQGHSDIRGMGFFDSSGNRLIDKVNLLVVLPLSHVYGLCTIAVAFLAGGSIFLLPNFNLKQILCYIQTYDITVFGGVPSMYAALASYPDVEKYNVSSVTRWLCGAAPLPGSVRGAFEKRFNSNIIEGYGLTETVSGYSLQRHDRLIKPGSVGQPVSGSEVRVVDDIGRMLPPGHVGEFIIKGANVMQGYYKNEAKTAEVIKDGWLYTGDIGYMDEDGDIFLIERKQDLIKRAGITIYPSEVEEVLLSHPDIREVGVMGIPEPEYGEQVGAFIVLKKGAKANKNSIKAFCRKSLPDYKVPVRIVFCDSLPKNELGRILRREIAKTISL
ncbi:AMP-dependent synthetase/ligase [Syntrophomonas zehnderi OL-4]|uniref:AMP-dependent synthetase/ligase n=1 Tax=Syntrophomonas zehnderi OL-4 TaxID=690567 RepID=A0A0E4GCW4_9FIRM|nr:AMP-binding protein [Syntrophomonas zehnderi]CFY08528.1 AMP-dependent synthetase/ligase [Syntrophomonas zehnderi OL-4]